MLQIDVYPIKPILSDDAVHAVYKVRYIRGWIIQVNVPQFPPMDMMTFLP